MSRVFMLFSFNDHRTVNTVLLDRFHVIKTDRFNMSHYACIIRRYLVPAILTEIGLHEEFMMISDQAIEEFLNRRKHGGIRQIRILLEALILRIHMWVNLQQDEFLTPLSHQDLERDATGKVIIKTGLYKFMEPEDNHSMMYI